MSHEKKRIAILCNGNSSVITDRVELITELHKYGVQPYTVGIYDGKMNPYYNENNSIFIPVLASRNNTNPLKEVKSIISVAKQMKRHKIDSAVIYGVKNHPAMALGCRLGRVKNILCVVNGSGNLFRLRGIKGFILRFMSYPMLRIAYNISNSVCFQNEDDKNLFIKKHILSHKTDTFITNGSGVNLNKFPQKPIPDDGSVLFLSRITPSKGLNEFIDAAYTVTGKGYNVKFDIVGPLDKSVENDPDNKLSKAVTEGVVNYHGETNDVPIWMSKSKIFVYPSYYPEGVPRCVLQAMSTGRPIITCDTPGCKSTVKDKVNGYLVQPKNSEEISEKIIHLLNNKNTILDMAACSRKMAEDLFDVDKINSVIISKLL